MAQREPCPQCGGEMRSNDPPGLCPACVVRQPLERDNAVAPIRPESSASDTAILERSSEPADCRSGPSDAATLPVAAPAVATTSTGAETTATEANATLTYSVARPNGQVE